MDVGIGIATYKRTKYLDHIIKEMIRTNVDLKDVVFFVDDDNEKDSFLKEVRKHQKTYGFKVVTNPHSGHRGNFTNIGNYFKEKGYEYYFYIEDDTVFCKNWFQCSVKILDELKGITFGLLALYCGYPHSRLLKIRPYIHENRGDNWFWGSCAWLLSIDWFDEIAEQMKKNHNPDTAVLSMKMEGAYYRIFVFAPNIAQHIGQAESSILPDIPPHRSWDFWGEDKDAMRLV